MVRIKYYTFSILLLLFSTTAYAATWVSDHADRLDSYSNYSGTVTLDTDTTTPDSTTTVYKFTYPAGTTVGHGIAAVWFGVPDGTNEIWLQYYYKFSPGFVYQDIATKHGYLYTSGSTSSNFMFAMGSRGYGYGITPQGSDFANYPPNTSGSVGGNNRWYFNSGVWHKVKLYFKFNIGSAWNGQYKCWIDDVQIANYSNVMYDRNFSGWRAVGIAPIWGGGVGNSVPSTQYFYVDGVYVGSTDPGGGGPSLNEKIPAPPGKLSID